MTRTSQRTFLDALYFNSIVTAFGDPDIAFSARTVPAEIKRVSPVAKASVKDVPFEKVY